MQEKQPNRLINETSPYLLQHAHNPVDWFPWGEEAFEKARAEDKPLLVSIGYSACHWCHVMEHESFEDPETAALMNENFVNIKVDMEERPDVDQIYMAFVQLTTGRGGWPMNVFITPDKKPFYGGTYFPPEPRYGMPSFRQILISIADAYSSKRDEILNSAEDIVDELKRINSAASISTTVSPDLTENAFASYVRSFDHKNGGFGGAPKFPQAMSLEFLLRYYRRTGNENALDMVKHTADKMAFGGMYDQLGGGFHRYAVDAVWLVPHFEKMLYDNAQLVPVYLHLFQITGESRYKDTAVEILEYVKREMLDAGGGFYSSQDADSEGEEGKFFVWSRDEIVEILGKDDADIFCKFYDITDEGNFEGHNIPNIKGGKTADDAVADRLQRAKAKLFAHRESRIKPFRDEKILTAWNGLMLSAFAEAAAILGNDEYLEIAENNTRFLLNELRADGNLLRTWKDGRAKLQAYIEDHANLADGLLTLFQATGNFAYLDDAKRLADLMITEFWDDDEGGFFFTANDHEELIVRNKDFYDNAVPSGNSAAADVLLKLASLLGDERYERFGTTVLRIAAAQITRHPQGFGRALSVIEFSQASVKEVVIAGQKGSELEREIWQRYLPFKVVMPVRDQTARDLPDTVKGKNMIDAKPTAYVCEKFVCGKPTTSAGEMIELLEKG